ncbi:MAG: T9SS type A sorting domain-containing protein [Bacteroidetes bacterium]|nr:T9SS type A sorting domain-containing protein [Bacteroidota bacterium]
MKKFTRFFTLAMAAMLMFLTSLNAQYKPSSPAFGSDVQLFSYVDCTNASSHIYVANNGWIYILTKLEASAINYQAWRVFYSSDDGVSFTQLCQWEYTTTDYILQDCDIVVTGENSGDIRLWIAEVTNSGTVTPHNAYLRVNEFDAAGNFIAQADYLDYGAAPNQLYSVALATDYRSPGTLGTPFSIGVAYTGNYSSSDWLSYDWSLDGGGSFTGYDCYGPAGAGTLGRVSLSLGATLSNPGGRMAVAFEMDKVGDQGNIGVISKYIEYTNVFSSWTTPVTVNMTYAPSAGKCRYPTIRIADNNAVDPTIALDYVPIIVAYEDWSSGASAVDIMYNALKASYVDLTQPTVSDFYGNWLGAGNGHSEKEPNFSFDKLYNNFLLTYASDYNNVCEYEWTSMNDILSGFWADWGNYRDASTPMPWAVQPKVDINPMHGNGSCYSWTQENPIYPGMYQILFDAEWSTVGIGEPQGQISDNSFVLNPNPAKEFVKIRFSKTGDYTVTMTSLLGQEVLNTILHGSESTLQLGDIAPGVYMVRVTGNGISAMKKLVVN